MELIKQFIGKKYILFFFGILILIVIITGCLSSPDISEKKCNNISYDPSKQSCCYGVLLDGPWTELGQRACINYTHYVPKRPIEYYCGGVITYPDDHLWCCNGTVYNSKTHHCCEGKIGPGDSFNWSMCGDSCYNLKTQSCCNETLCSEGWKCCKDKDKGPTCYNPNTQLCLISFGAKK